MVATNSTLIKLVDETGELSSNLNPESLDDIMDFSLVNSFDFDDLCATGFDVLSCADNAFTLLSYNVARNPLDILSHSNRIRVAYKENKPRHLYAALCDLYFSTGDKCRDIKLRLLEGSKSRLLKEDYDALLTSFNSDSEQLGFSNYSVLHKGEPDNCQLLIEKQISKNTRFNVLDEIDGYIEYGQLQEAKDALALVIKENDPGQVTKELHELLIDLYFKTNDSKGFTGFYSQLQNECPSEYMALWDSANQRIVI